MNWEGEVKENFEERVRYYISRRSHGRNVWIKHSVFVPDKDLLHVCYEIVPGTFDFGLTLPHTLCLEITSRELSKFEHEHQLWREQCAMAYIDSLGQKNYVLLTIGELQAKIGDCVVITFIDDKETSNQLILRRADFEEAVKKENEEKVKEI